MIKTETVLNGTNYKVSMQKIYLNYADILQNKNGRSAIELGLQQSMTMGLMLMHSCLQSNKSCG